MWICPLCGTDNEGEFCRVCNNSRPVEQTVAPNGQRNRIIQQKAPNNRERVAVNSATPEKTNGLLKSILLILIALVLIAGTCFVTLNLVDKDENPESEKTKQKEPEEITYSIYKNDKYEFFCAYPENFVTAEAEDNKDVLKCWKSSDGTAVMTLYGKKSGNMTIDKSIKEFRKEYGGEEAFCKSDKTWYAISSQKDNRIIYRKLFIRNSNMYWFDFEYNKGDADIYNDCVTYIEKNFKAL